MEVYMLKPMKVILASLLAVLISTPTFAHGGYYGGTRYYRGGGDWVAPFVVGGLVTYALTQPRVIYQEPVYVPAPAPVVVAPPVQPVVQQQVIPNVWYYCSSSKTYYPYVQSCPTGWQTVPAVPPHS
jgi:hypothetical protein